jgi:hypothetical protein
MAGVSDRLKKAAKTPTTKGASKPQLEGQAALVDRVIKMKNDLEDMQREYEQVEGELTVKTFDVYEAARKDGNYSSSIFAPGQKTNGAMVVYSDKFSNLPSEAEADLRAKDPNYDKHFVEVRKLTVKRDAGKTISDKTIETLIDALGDDFEKIFEVKVEVGTVKGFAEMWEDVPDTVKEMVRQAKPSVRNVTADGKVV